MVLRIAWIAPDFPWPLNSGNSVAIYYRIRELGKKGHQIHLFSTTTSSVEDESIHALSKYCKRVQVYRVGKSELMRNVLFSPFMPFRTARRYSRVMKRDIARCLASGDIDVLVVEHSAMAAYLTENQLRTVKTVILFQSLAHKSFYREAKYYPSPFSYKKYVSYIESFKTKVFEDRIFRSKMSDEYWFYSSDDMRDVLSAHPELTDQVKFIPIGVEMKENTDSTLFQIQGLSTADKMILLIGSMNNPSNEDSARYFAQKIFPRIKAEMAGVKFCIVGTNSTHKLKDIASGDILVMGEVPDLRPYLQRCDLYVVPQRGGGGVRTKFVDGLSAKKIVIATPVGVEAIKDIKPDIHFLLAGTEEEFAEKSMQVLKYPERFKEIAERGFNYFKDTFSVEVAGNVSESYLLSLTCQGRDD